MLVILEVIHIKGVAFRRDGWLLGGFGFASDHGVLFQFVFLLQVDVPDDEVGVIRCFRGGGKEFGEHK